ncbi:MAG: DUF2480 family protein [Bacteroidetes bacterium]|nr:MAG: DUF2480 family protein [Bacteroidota bacterium]MBL1143562.1 DUF2480 family protein [Bacteroidota bacterium]NOG56364.1 DUF2480 family protein [Bacteroidota bacterium]
MAEEIINRVANSSLITIDLEDFLPTGERVLLDIKQQLWQEIALKEKDFRQYIKETDWSVYQDKYVALTCSVDAIIPTWAYMLLTTAIAPFAKRVVFGDLNYLETLLLEEAINKIDFSEYQDARIVIKGCSNKVISPSIYVKVTEKLQPYVKVIMYGEPCSTVPLWKKPKS